MTALRPTTVAVGRFEDLLARGLRGLIEDDRNLSLVATDIRRSELSRVLRSQRPRVAIVDLATLQSPIEMRALTERHRATRFVLVAERLSSAESAQLLAFGAAACVSRTTQARDVLNAVHLAARGMQLTPRSFDQRALDASTLTAREADVLAELQLQRSNAQIASDLHISVETVRTHARSIYRKLGVSSRRELTPASGGGRAAAAAA